MYVMAVMLARGPLAGMEIVSPECFSLLLARRGKPQIRATRAEASKS